ncbi:MAG TPA: hypothetical protein VF032_19550 [Thermoleophilaceae bacterium]
MPCELICPACGRGYYTAASYEEAYGAVCDVDGRELVPVAEPARGGLTHLPPPQCVDIDALAEWGAW